MAELAAEPLGPLDTRSLLRLSANERDRLMEQVAVVTDEYEDGGGLSGFESLSWKDHFDASLDD